MNGGVAQVVKSAGPKLVPFFKTVAVYFVLFLDQGRPSVFSTVIKCLPIVSLMLFVLLHGMSLGEQHSYARKILVGLIFCSIGDAFLIWPNCFHFGMTAFAIGHICYILAFGFNPTNWKLGVGLQLVTAVIISYLAPGLQGILIPGVPIYCVIITTMVWRATSRLQMDFSRICAALGAILFATSDTILGIDKFNHKIDQAQLLVMSTYYAAQMLISLSIVDAKRT